MSNLSLHMPLYCSIQSCCYVIGYSLYPRELYICAFWWFLRIVILKLNLQEQITQFFNYWECEACLWMDRATEKTKFSLDEIKKNKLFPKQILSLIGVDKIQCTITGVPADDTNPMSFSYVFLPLRPMWPDIFAKCWQIRIIYND